MFSALRRRATYANVAMTLALVFAMTGGAYAAKKYLITSTKQISPSVLKQLGGKVGPAGANGKNGAPGAQGPQGPAGANGKDGVNGANGQEGRAGAKGVTGPQGPAGATGAKGAEGAKGATGSQGPAGPTGATGQINTEGPLPVGKTETGGWSVSGLFKEGVFSFTLTSVARTAISFPVPLKADLELEKLQGNPVGFPAGATAEQEEHCPGSVTEPKAASGFFCIYSGQLEGTLFNPFSEMLSSNGSFGNAFGASRAGAIVEIGVGANNEPEAVSAAGSWAVTG